MKKASKYDNMFDKMRGVLIEYATAKDEQGRWLHKTPEIMRKFGFGDDPKVIDGFNRWLNRQGIYRVPKPKRATPSDELFPVEENPALVPVPDTPERDPVTAMLADCGALNQIARALNYISEGVRAIAEAVGLHILTETVHTNGTATTDD